METNITGRNFLVGCVRSGTTLLTALLASHSKVASFPETMFFRYLIGNAGQRYYGIEPAGPRERLRSLARSAAAEAGLSTSAGRYRVQTFLSEIGREDLAPLFPQSGRSLKQQVKGCVRILDALASEQKKPVWIEKSPDHLAYIDEIARSVKPAKFIHILRNGPDNIASMYDAAMKYPDTHWNVYFGTVDRCITQWKHNISLSQRHAESPDHLIVHYEQLVTSAPDVLARICGFLELEYEETMINNYGDAAKGIVLEGSVWKHGVFGGIRTGISKFDIFTDEQKQHILDQLQELSSVPSLRPLCVVQI